MEALSHIEYLQAQSPEPAGVQLEDSLLAYEREVKLFALGFDNPRLWASNDEHFPRRA